MNFQINTHRVVRVTLGILILAIIVFMAYATHPLVESVGILYYIPFLVLFVASINLITGNTLARSKILKWGMAIAVFISILFALLLFAPILMWAGIIPIST